MRDLTSHSDRHPMEVALLYDLFFDRSRICEWKNNDWLLALYSLFIGPRVFYWKQLTNVVLFGKDQVTVVTVFRQQTFFVIFFFSIFVSLWTISVIVAKYCKTSNSTTLINNKDKEESTFYNQHIDTILSVQLRQFKIRYH